MFKVGDFVALNRTPYSRFVVTRVYSNDYMAIANYDVLDGKLFNEFKVKQKYFNLCDLDDFDVPGTTYHQILDNLTDDYFIKDGDNYILVYTEDSKDGISPSYGLPLDEFGFTATE